jgi:hypothetical protein
LNLWIKSYGEMKILGKVWARWACFESTSKSWPHVQKNVGKRKEGNFGRGEFRDPARGWPATSSHPSATACSLIDCGPAPYRPLFSNFFNSFFGGGILWGSLKMSLAFRENGCTALPFFEPCSYTWNGEIFHSSWSLEILFYFPNFFC